MLYRKFAVVFAFGLAVLMAACSPAAGSQEEDEPQPTEAPTTEVIDEPTQAVDETTEPTLEGIPHPAVLEAMIALAEKLEIDMADIELVSNEQVEWTDSCLGLGGPAESCLQAITPGWRVILKADGVDYEVRTDETGASVRIAESIAP